MVAVQRYCTVIGGLKQCWISPRARACIYLAFKFPRKFDDGQYRQKYVVVSIV